MINIAANWGVTRWSVNRWDAHGTAVATSNAIEVLPMPAATLVTPRPASAA